MLRHTLFIAFAMAAILAPTDWLQAQDEPRERPAQDERRGGLGQGEGRRGDGQRRQGRRGRGPDMEQFYDRVTQELALDEQQQAQIEEIRAAQRERMEAFRERRSAIRQAEQDGDEQLAQQLRDEMRSEFEQNVGRRRGFMEETVQSIDAILTEDQRAQFTTMRENMRTERETQMRERFEQRYDRLAEELQLDDDQRQVLEDVKAGQMERMEAFRDRWQAVREAYDDGDDALGDELREELVSEMREGGGPRQFVNEVYEELDPVLTDEQREIAAELRAEREDRRRNRGDRRREAAAEAGQPDAANPKPTSPEAQIMEQLNGDRPAMTAGREEDLASTLDMTDEQQAGYAALQAARQLESKQLADTITQVEAKLAAANAEGDEAKIEALSRQLADLETLAETQENAFHQSVNNLLSDDQKAVYADYQADLQVANELKDIPADLRTVLRAAMRLKLDRTQKGQVRDMMKEARKDLRAARATDKKNRDRERTAEKALAGRYKTRIRNLLTTEQSLKYTEHLDKMTPRKTKRPTRGI